MARPLFDPLASQLIAIAGEAAIGAERLDSNWLRERLANPPPHWMSEDIDERRWRQITHPLRPAAVMIAIVQRESGPTLLFTQRTADLTDHAGQISFPGGRMEESDASMIETAQRETEEEIGLAREHIEILGRMPDYLTGTGYKMAPVVGLVTPPFELKPDPREVAEVFEVPLAFLMDGVNHQRRVIELPKQSVSRTFYAIQYQHYFIWGATAAILRNLFHLLRS
ncbi:MAG: CoA pyrophosphatase [Herbaspirillum sp.]|nr:CoA pyrophosphatase [Herbaspirillum sp.]